MFPRSRGDEKTFAFFGRAFQKRKTTLQSHLTRRFGSLKGRKIGCCILRKGQRGGGLANDSSPEGDRATTGWAVSRKELGTKRP